MTNQILSFPTIQNYSDQLRCYSAPAFIVKLEKELLATHQADDLADLLNKIYDDLYLTSYLMVHFERSTAVKGETMQLIGGRLQSSLCVLDQVCTAFADFNLTNQSRCESETA